MSKQQSAHTYILNAIFQRFISQLSMQDRPNNTTPPPPTDQVNKPSVTSRRSRKDEEGRDFQCGCGKRYLSYPALYTHIKTKHDGKQPEGTLKSGAPHIAKRVKSKLDQETVKSIKAYFKPDIMKIFKYLSDEAVGQVPLNSRIKRETVPKQVFEAFLNLLKEKQVRLSSTSSLELALTVYLLNVGSYVNDRIYDNYLHFAKLARSAYADHGDEIYNCLFSGKSSPFSLPDFNSSHVAYFPIVADFIVTDCVGRLFPTQLEGKDISPSLIELITYEFCTWLHEQRLTQLKVALSDDFKLDYQILPPSAGKRAVSSNAQPEKEQEEGKNGEEGSDEVSDPQNQEEDRAILDEQ